MRKVFPFLFRIIKESEGKIGKFISKGIMKESQGKRGFIMALRPEWEGFNPEGLWTSEVNVRDFIQANYTQFDGDESFLAEGKILKQPLLQSQ